MFFLHLRPFSGDGRIISAEYLICSRRIVEHLFTLSVDEGLVEAGERVLVFAGFVFS